MTLALGILAMGLMFAGVFWTLFHDAPQIARQIKTLRAEQARHEQRRKNPSA